MRLALVLAALAAVVAVGAGLGATVAPTQLVITVYPSGVGQPGANPYRLRCSPAAGTVPQPAHACAVLSRLAHPFAPTPPGTMCSDISLGPEEASVVGRLAGQTVHARLSLQDSCEIDRWRRLAAVVPGFPGR